MVVRKISLGASRIGSLIRRVIKEMYDRDRYESGDPDLSDRDFAIHWPVFSISPKIDGVTDEFRPGPRSSSLKVHINETK